MSASEAFARPTLRFRRFGGGYRREDVERVLAELRLTVHALELELPSLRERSLELEARLREVRTEPVPPPPPLDGVARAAAERWRSELEDLVRSREAALGAIRAVVGDLGDVLARAAAADIHAAPASRSLTALPGTPVAIGSDLVASHVELDAGPFADFDAVFAFERCLAELPRIEDIHVRRLRSSRATISLTLSESTRLLAQLREHLPYSLELQGARGGRLLLDVGPLHTPGAG